MKANAIRSLIGNKDREQTVFTPQRILDVPQRLWGRIQYDAATCLDGRSLVNAVEATDCLGLIMPWPKYTWVNPPFNVLHAWLVMSMLQDAEHMMLVPARPHRKWWRKWRREAEVVALNPFAFVGHKGVFPAPLVLAHRNSPTPGAMTALCVEHELGEAW